MVMVMVMGGFWDQKRVKNGVKKFSKKIVEIFEKTVDKYEILLYNSPCVPMKAKIR